MKNRISTNKALVILSVLLGLLIVSCSKKTPTPVSGRLEPERAITITNNTGVEIKGYQVNVANGIEIDKGTLTARSKYIKLDENLINDLNIEVVLVDQFDRIYANTFYVSLEGNTDTPITADDRKSEGPLTDKWKDLVAWLNRR